MECGDLSPLCSVATCRDRRDRLISERRGVKPPRTKAVTGHRTPKVVTRRRADRRNEGAHACVVLPTRHAFKPAASINREWIHLVNRIGHILRRQTAGEE
mgnify:CR=1 FL=1